MLFIQHFLSAYQAPGTVIGASGKDLHLTRSAQAPTPGVSPSAGQGLGWEGCRAGRGAGLDWKGGWSGRGAGLDWRSARLGCEGLGWRGAGLGREGRKGRPRGYPRAEARAGTNGPLTAQDPGGGWNAFSQRKPRLSETRPLSPPAQTPAPAPVARRVSIQVQGRAGPQAPLPPGARVSGSSSSLRRVHPHRLPVFVPQQRNGGPSPLTVSSFPFTFHPYEAYV